ncbi:RICIN domain-containing protein [Streptomyces oryzae]|uniref:RICIN domain-containing protein n=1 Tax=Streptomyces oryzae TaxID=1434886 RepID=A0ABS3XI97_9ACTN|nr:RICIN domain-containing protein [Streptomyces oryzae]MBO8195140.1 RICIN domain-containing protein [Streptomyces oryzae]
MPSKEPTDPGGPAVRRAVPLPGSTPPPADPDVLPSSAPAPAPGESAESAAGPTAPPDFAPASSPRPDGPTEPIGVTAPSAASSTSAGTGTVSPGPDGDQGAGADGATAAGADDDPPESRTATGGDEEPPSGRPTKALRAAAALAGALLIAVPLIALGTGDDDEKDSGTGRPVGAAYADGDSSQNVGSYKDKSSEHKSSKDGKDEKGKEGGEKDGDSGSDVEPGSGGKNSSKDDKSEDAGSSKSQDKQALYTGPGARLPDQLELVNVMTGMCVDVPGKGGGKVNGHVNQDPCAMDRRTDNQAWYMDVKKKRTSKHDRLVVFRNAKDKLCLDLPGYGGVPSGTGVVEAPCNGTFKDNQLWWLDRRGTHYWIRNYRSEQMCLDVHGKSFGGGGEDARLGVARCNPKDDHEWRLA